MVPLGSGTSRAAQLDLFRFDLKRARLDFYLIFSGPVGPISCKQSYRPSDFLISALVTRESLLSRRRSKAI